MRCPRNPSFALGVRGGWKNQGVLCAGWSVDGGTRCRQGGGVRGAMLGEGALSRHLECASHYIGGTLRGLATDQVGIVFTMMKCYGTVICQPLKEMVGPLSTMLAPWP